MDATAAATLERELRKDYGGQRRYIARNAPADSAQRRDKLLQLKRHSLASLR